MTMKTPTVGKTTPKFNFEKHGRHKITVVIN